MATNRSRTCANSIHAYLGLLSREGVLRDCVEDFTENVGLREGYEGNGRGIIDSFRSEGQQKG